MKILKNVFFILIIQSFVVFSLLFPQFPDSNGKTKKRNFCNHVLQLKRLITSSGIFAFQNFVHKKWLCAKEKIKLPFPWYLLKTTYFQKSNTCIDCFGLFTKLKKAYGTRFYCRFSAYLLHKNVSYQILKYIKPTFLLKVLHKMCF